MWILEMLSANLATIITAMVLLLIIILIIRSKIKEQKKGGCGCGCPGCTGGCPHSASNNKKMEEQANETQ